MFFIQWDDEDWKQPSLIVSYVIIGIAGIIYASLTTATPSALLGGLADVGGALFLLALVIEGAVWTMVMALGKIREARNRGREEGREEGKSEERAAMIEALREAGIPESDIRRVQERRNARDNGRPQG